MHDEALCDCRKKSYERALVILPLITILLFLFSSIYMIDQWIMSTLPSL